MAMPQARNSAKTTAKPAICAAAHTPRHPLRRSDLACLACCCCQEEQGSEGPYQPTEEAGKIQRPVWEPEEGQEKLHGLHLHTCMRRRPIQGRSMVAAAR